MGLLAFKKRKVRFFLIEVISLDQMEEVVTWGSGYYRCHKQQGREMIEKNENSNVLP